MLSFDVTSLFINVKIEDAFICLETKLCTFHYSGNQKFY